MLNCSLTFLSMRQKITPHFTRSEMTKTDTGLPNVPTPQAEIHLVYLCRALERVRAKINQGRKPDDELPIVVNSGYRSKQVNTAIGGSSTSYHLDGRAVDIDIKGYDVYTLDKLLDALYDEFPSELYTKSSYVHFAI